MASPVLSNIYLDRLDKFAETMLIPEYTRGKSRKANPAWTKVARAIAAARRRGDRAAVRDLRQQRRGLPTGDPGDPGYRRLRYIRYADDHLFGFTGPKAEAEQIKQRLARFLHDDLKLELSPDKTLITHARTQAARFLGYDITVQHSLSRPAVNGVIGLRVPTAVITAKTAPYLKHGKPWHRPELMNLDDPAIISAYGAQYRGLAQYYLLAGNVSRLHRLRWVMETSMLKTLGAKHRSTVTKMARKYKAVTVTRTGPGPVSRPAPSGRAGNHWSHGSAASRSNGRRKRSSTTACQPRPPAARNWSPGSSKAGASGASNAPRCKHTRPASWPTSANRDRPSPNGPA